jgi:hypothetical protein
MHFSRARCPNRSVETWRFHRNRMQAWNFPGAAYIARMKGIVLLPIAALFITTGCNPSSSSSQSPSTNASANATNADSVPYYGAMIKAKRNATTTADVASLKPAIDQFQVEKGRFPKDLNELVQEKYISKVPDAPYGMKLDYDPATGVVKVVPQQ